MIKKISKVFVLVFFVLGCSSSKIKNADMLHSFTFGLFGHDDFEFCKENDLKFMDTYPNGKYPGKICTKYRQYTCHIKYYCKGNKDCEEEASLFWLPTWQGTENDLVKRAEFTKEKCDIEAKKNSNIKN